MPTHYFVKENKYAKKTLAQLKFIFLIFRHIRTYFCFKKKIDIKI